MHARAGLALAVVLGLVAAVPAAAHDPKNGRIAFVSDRDGNDILSAFSPDGKLIAFTTNRDAQPPTPESPYEVYAMNADGSNEHNLTNSLDSNDFWPTWQPLFHGH